MIAFSEQKDLAISLYGLEPIEVQLSSKQKIELFRHRRLGQVLIIDGELQHIERLQSLYHEPLVHLPASFVTELKTGLVLGGGSLFAAAELLRYPTIKRCILVDHDPLVLDIMVRNYDHAARVVADSRFEYVERDAIDYLQATNMHFDLIINDCFDSILVGLERRLSIFSLMKSKLTKDGVCGEVLYRDVFQHEYVARAREKLEALGPHAISLIFVPEYPGILHFLTVWGNPSVRQSATSSINQVHASWLRRSPFPILEFFNPRFLDFHLYVPPYIRALWGRFRE